jgi:hypothetical protein
LHQYGNDGFVKEWIINFLASNPSRAVLVSRGFWANGTDQKRFFKMKSMQWVLGKQFFNWDQCVLYIVWVISANLLYHHRCGYKVTTPAGLWQ